jgi:hypothetical protein
MRRESEAVVHVTGGGVAGLNMEHAGRDSE